MADEEIVDGETDEDHVLLCARALYEQTDVPMARIARLMGVGQSTLSRRVLRMGWKLRLPYRSGRRKEPDLATMKGLSGRVRAHIERQILLADYDLDSAGRLRSFKTGSTRGAGKRQRTRRTHARKSCEDHDRIKAA